MPSLPPRSCTHPHCKEHATKQGRCNEHQREAWESNKGKSASQRGYGHRWTKLRNRIMQRDNYLCQPCLNKGIFTEAQEVDHIINKASEGNDHPDNLQAICKPCHKVKTQSESKAV